MSLCRTTRAILKSIHSEARTESNSWQMFLKGFPKLTFFHLFELSDIECFSTGSYRFEAKTYIYWIKFGKICHDFTVIYIGHSEGRWYAIHHQLNWQNLKRKARWSIFLRRKLPENGLWKWAQISCCLSRVGLSLLSTDFLLHSIWTKNKHLV